MILPPLVFPGETVVPPLCYHFWATYNRDWIWLRRIKVPEFERRVVVGHRLAVAVHVEGEHVEEVHFQGKPGENLKIFLRKTYGETYDKELRK